MSAELLVPVGVEPLEVVILSEREGPHCLAPGTVNAMRFFARRAQNDRRRTSAGLY